MKKHLKLILRTLFSNNACVEAARTKETKYTVVAIVFALLALFFAALPTCVTGFQQNGGSCVRGVTYDFENGMLQLKEDMGENVKFKIIDDNGQRKLVAEKWEEVGHYNWTEEGITVDKPNLYCCIATAPDREVETPSEHKILEVYYCPEDKDFSLYVEEIAKNIDPTNITRENKEEEEKKPENFLEMKPGVDGGDPTLIARTTSFIVFGTTQVQMAICPPGISQIASSVYGDYGNTPINDNLIATLVPSNNEDILNACATFFDQVYVNPRRANTWKSTGIILGVDAGVVLLMGFMVWILTRGKNNPFRIYSFWDGQKIAYYAALTPGILSLFGFLMANMAMMLFILGTGVRVMWLSMRTLRYQAPAK